LDIKEANKTLIGAYSQSLDRKVAIKDLNIGADRLSLNRLAEEKLKGTVQQNLRWV
jgi:hypothetical protein